MTRPASEPLVLRVALPVPLPGGFDYLAPNEGRPPAPGMRVLAPFGRRRLVGIVMAAGIQSQLPVERLRPVIRTLDTTPAFDAPLLRLLRWAARYYHYPLGEALATALPAVLRKATAPVAGHRHRGWRALAWRDRDIVAELARAPRQREIYDHIRAHSNPTAHATLLARNPQVGGPLKALAKRGLIEAISLPGGLEHGSAGPAPQLTDEQAKIVQWLQNDTERFAPALVEGVTGSGKTEIYFQCIAAVLAKGRQVLFLAPEIGLTPQLIERVRQRFDAAFGVLHSQRSDGERSDVWRAAGSGDADIIIGTRSAVFTPMPRLGLIVVDEEHDGSYKQQDGFRYHARDVALRRAQLARIPIVLGSATPALETLHNVEQGRLPRLQLPRRATGTPLPPIRVIDVRSRPLDGGLSQPLLARIEPHLAAGNQVMIFINRRGFAPILSCHDCGWVALCERCDTPLTLHAGGTRLQCHHCGACGPAPAACSACGRGKLVALGAGTERVTGALRSRFPDVTVARFDRDSMTRKGQLETQLADAARGTTQLLVGTQMLAKGHDFARLTCVGVLDVDGGLFSVDFRAAEHMAQLITQVAGRAGRAELPGEVWLQTRHPDHPLLLRLLEDGYTGFADAALAERREAGLPPFGHIALLRAQAHEEHPPHDFLTAAAAQVNPASDVACWGPVPAPMPRRAGRQRAQLLLHANARAPLHAALDHWQRVLPELPLAKRVRWSIDVDPQEML